MSDQWSINGVVAKVEELDFTFVQGCKDPLKLLVINRALYTDYPGFFTDLEAEVHLRLIELMGDERIKVEKLRVMIHILQSKIDGAGEGEPNLSGNETEILEMAQTKLRETLWGKEAADKMDAKEKKRMEKEEKRLQNEAAVAEMAKRKEADALAKAEAEKADKARIEADQARSQARQQRQDSEFLGGAGRSKTVTAEEQQAFKEEMDEFLQKLSVKAQIDKEMLLACSQALRMNEEQLAELPEKSRDATKMIRTGEQCADMREACREFHDWMRSKGMPVHDAIEEIANDMEKQESDEKAKWKEQAKAANLEPEMLQACATAMSLTEEQVNQMGEQEKEAIMALRLAPQFEDVRQAVYEAGRGGDMAVPVKPKADDEEAKAKAKEAEAAFMKEVEAAKAKQEKEEEKRAKIRQAKEAEEAKTKEAKEKKEAKEAKEKKEKKEAEPQEEEILEMGADGTFDFDAKAAKDEEEFNQAQQAKEQAKEQRTAGDLKDYFRSWEKFDVDEEEEKVETAPSTSTKKSTTKAPKAKQTNSAPTDDEDRIMLDPIKVKAVAEKMGIEGGAEMLRVVTQALCFSDRQIAGLANEAHMKVRAIRNGPEFSKHRAAAAMLGVDEETYKRVRSRRNGGKSKSSKPAAKKSTPSTAEKPHFEKGSAATKAMAAKFKAQQQGASEGAATNKASDLNAVAAAAAAAFKQQQQQQQANPTDRGSAAAPPAPPAASSPASPSAAASSPASPSAAASSPASPPKPADAPEGKENSPPRAAKNSPPKPPQPTKAAPEAITAGADGSSGSGGGGVPSHTVKEDASSLKIVVQLPAIDSMKGVDIDVVSEKNLVLLDAPHYDRLAIDLSSYGANVDSSNVRAKFSKKKKVLTITLGL
jgi:hypothetical protein